MAKKKQLPHADAPKTARQPTPSVDISPLMDLSRTINAVVVRSLAAVDATVTVPQLRVMVILSVHDRLNLSGVADRLGVNASNASRTCDQLVRRGLVGREHDPHDRRNLSLALARPGRRLLDDVMRRREAMLAEMVARMRPEDQAALMNVVTVFNAVVGDATADPSDADLLTRWISR